MSNDQLAKLGIGLACVLGIGYIFSLNPGDASEEREIPKPVMRVAKETEPKETEPKDAEPGVSAIGGSSRPVPYAEIMERGAGTPIINSTGGLNMQSVEVAVPDRFGKVQFLKGTDTRAVEYLESVREKQAAVVVDNGPLDVDLGTVPRPGSLGGRRVKIPVTK